MRPHGHRVVGDDQVAGVGFARPSRSSRSQKRSILASSSGASTSSSTQIGAGLVRNSAKISAMAVSACSPPESNVSDCSRLPGGWAKISRPASSGSSTRPARGAPARLRTGVVNRRLEMRVHLLERSAQPLAAFAVEVADRAAQAVDRFGQLGLLGFAWRRARFSSWASSVGGDEVDRADPLALGDELFHRRGFLDRPMATCVGLEAELAARAAAAGTGTARPTRAPSPRGARPRSRPRAAAPARASRAAESASLASASARIGGRRSPAPRRRPPLRPGRVRAVRRSRTASPLLDLAHQRGGLGRGHRALAGDLLEPARHVGEPPRGIARARFPAR